MAVGVSTTEINKILKLDYQGPIREQLINKNVLLSLVKRDYSRQGFQGLKSVIPMHVGRNIGRGWRVEDAILPEAGQQSYAQVHFHVHYLYGRIGITGQAIAQSRNDRGAFARALDLEMKGLTKDLSLTMQKAVWSDGSGRLTDCVRNTDGAINTENEDQIQVCSDRWLEVGMPVFVANKAGKSAAGANGFLTAADGKTYISAIGATNNTIELRNASSTTAGVTVTLANDETPANGTLSQEFNDTEGHAGAAHNYALYQWGARRVGASATSTVAKGGECTTTDWTKPSSIWGLQALISDSNPSAWTDSHADLRHDEGLVGETDRTDAANSWWKSQVVDNADGVACPQIQTDFTKFQEAYDTAEIQGDVTPGLILTSYRVRRNLADDFAQDRRYGTEEQLKGGWTGLKFNNAVIVCDKDAHDVGDPRDAPIFGSGLDDSPSTGFDADDNAHFNDCYFLSRSNLQWNIMEDLSWEDTGGVIVREAVGTAARDRYEAFMKAYWNLAITDPKAHVILKNVR